MGKLIVIEGVDGTGKQTQVRRLAAWFRAQGKKVKEISFPDYDSPACMPVKMYLSGDFGTTPGSVSPYQAAPLYTIDRFASFVMDWKESYQDPDCIVLSDRYVGSNAYHQGEKCKSEKELNEFLDWLYDFEFTKYKLPVPDQTFWLDLDPEQSQEWVAKRNNKFSGEAQKDIHESNLRYLKDCYRVGCIVAQKWGWVPIECMFGKRVLSAPEISGEIINRLISEEILQHLFAGEMRHRLIT